MRSKNVALSLTGTIGVLAVLALSLLWGTLAGAATALPDGTLSTDIQFVSPDTANIGSGDRTVAATLTNLDLNTPEYVGAGPAGEASDFDLDNSGTIDADDVVLITMDALVPQGDTFRIRLDDALAFDFAYTIDIQAITDGVIVTADLIPLVGSDGVSAATAADIRIADEADAIAGVDIGPGEVSVVNILDVPNGRITFQAIADIQAGETFAIQFVTSPQESALVNVKGDSDNFDLLLVESAAGPAGEYDGSYVVADSIIIDMGTAIVNTLNGITHEQHNVPGGLRGNVLFNDEVHNSTGDISTGDLIFNVTVDNPPIREGVRPVTVTQEPTGVDLTVVEVVDATTGVIAVRYDASSSSALATTDNFGITYRGSDDFTFTVEFAPIQAGGLSAFIVPSRTDDVVASTEFFTVISTDLTSGAIRVGVTVGTADDDAVAGQGQADLSSHITVLGVSYLGSEQVEIPIGGVLDGATFDATVNFPPEDANQDSIITGDDVVKISTAGLTAGDLSVSGVIGSSITFTANGDLVAGDTFTIAYAFSAGADPRNALVPAAAARPSVLVGAGSRSTVASANDKVTVDAEADAPEFENDIPADGSATSDIAVTLSIDITDALAGVGTASIVFLLSDDTGDDSTDASVERFGDDAGETVTVSTVGTTVTASVDLDEVDIALPGLSIDANGTTTVFWWVEASDNASNTGTSDTVLDDDTDPSTLGNQSFTTRVDAEDPQLESVFIGDVWNSATQQIEGDRRIGVGSFLPGSSNPSVIRVKFNEDLSGKPATDAFSVIDDASNVLAIERVDWFDDDDSTTGLSVRDSAFLVLVSPLDAGAIVSVELIGAVSDAAGNSISTSVVTEADDGIAPTATVSLDTALSTQAVVVTVVTDEGIRTLEPELNLFVSTTDVSESAAAINARTLGVSIPRAVRTPGEDTWTFTLGIALANKYSVVVAGEDAGRNRGTTGVEVWPGAAGPITFEVDNALPITAQTAAGTDNSTLPAADGVGTDAETFFIEINWLAEAQEYTGDSQITVDLTVAVLDKGTDDERDLIAEGAASTRDGVRWTLAVSDIGLDEHTLTYNGTDALGNTRSDDETLTFTVVERPTFDLGLTPGLNLVSVPGQPADTSIDSVFGSFPAVDLIFTREGDEWLVALRNPTTGAFEGALSTIDSQHAYWVRATASTTVPVEIPVQGPQQLLPAIQVKGDQWNLVPVISLLPLEKLEAGVSTLDADNYFGTNWTRAFSFDRGLWQPVIPTGGLSTHLCENREQTTTGLTGAGGTIGAGDNAGSCGLEDAANAGQFFLGDLQPGVQDSVQIGSGYWVYFTDDDTITP